MGRIFFFSNVLMCCRHSKTNKNTAIFSKNKQFCCMLRPCPLWQLNILGCRQRREAASDRVAHVLYYCEGVPFGERAAGNIARSKVSHHHSLEQDGEANVTRIRGKAINCPVLTAVLDNCWQTSLSREHRCRVFVFWLCQRPLLSLYRGKLWIICCANRHF